MRPPAPAAPGALRALALAACARAAAGFFGRGGGSAVERTTFAVVSDWGGIGTAPYTTPSQLAVASAMETVGSATDFSFVLSAGNNFRPVGLQGAPRSWGGGVAAAPCFRAFCAQAGAPARRAA